MNEDNPYIGLFYDSCRLIKLLWEMNPVAFILLAALIIFGFYVLWLLFLYSVRNYLPKKKKAPSSESHGPDSSAPDGSSVVPGHENDLVDLFEDMASPMERAEASRAGASLYNGSEWSSSHDA